MKIIHEIHSGVASISIWIDLECRVRDCAEYWFIWVSVGIDGKYGFRLNMGSTDVDECRGFVSAKEAKMAALQAARRNLRMIEDRQRLEGQR